MYEPLNEWKTTLCHPDFESCTLACYFPCHIYAMANKPFYAIYFISYAFCILSIHCIYYELYYLKMNQCPSSKIDYCFGATDCESHYMIMDGITTPCRYYEQICGYSELSCIQSKNYTYSMLMIVLSLFYLSFFCMNYFVRQKIKQTKHIQGNDYCESTLPCGLAQVYREIV
jgi:hypothetical protein